MSNIYKIKPERKKKAPQQEDDNEYMEWFEEHFKDLYDGDSRDDLLWMMKGMTPLAKIE